MSRSAPFRQVDVTRALKGAAAAGVKVSRIEIDPTGRIVVVAERGAEKEPVAPLDDWRAGRGSG